MPNQLGPLSRIVRAVQWRAGQAFERFLGPVEREMQAQRVDPQAVLRRMQQEAQRGNMLDGIIGGASVLAMAEQGFVAPPDGKRPPSKEYGDLPIGLWADWNVKAARSTLADHAIGMFARSGLLVESMLGDDRVQTAFNGFVKGITKCEPTFTPADDPLGQQVCDELSDVWEDMLAEEDVENLFQWSRFCGFALAELVWEPWENQNRWIPRLKVWHPLYIYYRVDIRRYVAITTEGSIEIDPDDPKWLLFTPFGAYRGWLRGAVRGCAVPWLVRQFALRDWARFSEVHGLPIRVAKVPAQAPSEDKARFFQSVRNLGAESVMLLPVQSGPEAAVWDATLLEAKDRSWEAFPGLRDMCDTSITLSIRGTNLTTAVGTGNSGNRAAADTHREEDQDYAVSERRKFCRRVRVHLLRWYCVFNYGTTAVVPKKLSLVDPDGEDVMGELKTMQEAAKTVVELRGAGASPNASEIFATANVPVLEGVKVEDNKPNVVLAPTDVAAVVTVDEARAVIGLEPWHDAEAGKQSIEEFKNSAKPEPAPGEFGGGGFGGAKAGKPNGAAPVSPGTEEPKPEPSPEPS